MIRKSAVILIFSAVCLISSNTAQALFPPPISPVITGQLSGIEYSTQALFGQARFSGNFTGTVNGKFAFGYWSVAANHEPLPDQTGSKALMKGEWELEVYVLNGFWFQSRTFGGPMSGVLYNRGDNNLPVDNFDVLAKLLDTSTGGIYGVQGILYHDTFPPTLNLSFETP